MTTPVTDAISNWSEYIQYTANFIGISEPRRTVYKEAYRGAKRIKTVTDIAERTGLSPKMVLDRGRELEKAHIVRGLTVDGRKAYQQIPSQLLARDKVLAVAGNRKAIDSIITKRSVATPITIFKPLRSQAAKRARPSKTNRASPGAECNVAFLMAAPSAAGAINVGKYFREAQKVIALSANRDRIAIRPYLAAGVDDILDTLNQFKPHILQFSGHGDTGLLLLDKEEISDTLGSTVKFRAIRSLLGATDSPPNLVVMAACQTASEAHTLLDTVPVVIGMDGYISDLASALFTRRFYAAIVSGQSIANSFLQAKAALKAVDLEDADFPKIFVRSGSDASQKKLVS